MFASMISWVGKKLTPDQIAALLRWLGSILTQGHLTADLLGLVRKAVGEAEACYPQKGSGAEKKAWVLDQVNRLWGDVQPFVFDTAVQIALGALRLGIAAL